MESRLRANVRMLDERVDLDLEVRVEQAAIPGCAKQRTKSYPQIIGEVTVLVARPAPFCLS
jgi:hypothetical protein